ncbi:unnamed protein product [Phytophthora fragariaefolia]|uniref:Unnamed protein product n=1 Tax=Phytophthora fragariaefolia TaxID=1490495 RepID=A0A9W6XXI2_9STRA|nr:unnamed protein product [Phytophthora fragariaefolia]
MQNYDSRTSFLTFSLTKESGNARDVDGFLDKATTLGYSSQITNLLRERYPEYLSDTMVDAKIRDEMVGSIEEPNLHANLHTNDAPGCTPDVLCLLVQTVIANGDIATDLKSMHDAALLTVMWNTFALAPTFTFAGRFLNLFTNKIWETVKGKREQNKGADVKAAINIMLVLYQAPCSIFAPPLKADTHAQQTWEDNLWKLALALEQTANACLHAINSRKPSIQFANAEANFEQHTTQRTKPLVHRTMHTRIVVLSLTCTHLLRISGPQVFCHRPPSNLHIKQYRTDTPSDQNTIAVDLSSHEPGSKPDVTLFPEPKDVHMEVLQKNAEELEIEDSGGGGAQHPIK